MEMCTYLRVLFSSLFNRRQCIKLYSNYYYIVDMRVSLFMVERRGNVIIILCIYIYYPPLPLYPLMLISRFIVEP